MLNMLNIGEDITDQKVGPFRKNKLFLVFVHVPATKQVLKELIYIFCLVNLQRQSMPC